MISGQLSVEHAATIRSGICIGLVPFDAGSHLKEILYLHAFVCTASQFREVLRDRIIEAFDVTVLNGRCDES